MKEILDTNVLVRFLVGDTPAHQRQAEAWFEEARNRKRTLVVDPIVIAETSFVLESVYKKDRQEIADALEVFVSQRWLRVESRRELVALWMWYRRGLHFVDSFLLAWSQIHHGEVLTFDKKLAKQS